HSFLLIVYRMMFSPNLTNSLVSIRTHKCKKCRCSSISFWFFEKKICPDRTDLIPWASFLVYCDCMPVDFSEPALSGSVVPSWPGVAGWQPFELFSTVY